MLNLKAVKEKLNNTNGNIKEQFLKTVQEEIDSNAKLVPKDVIESLERFLQLGSLATSTYVLVSANNENYLLWCRKLIGIVEVNQAKVTKILEEIQHLQSRLNSLTDFFSE